MVWTAEERETVLRFDYIDKKWIIYTNIQKHWRRFKKNGFVLIKETFDPKTGIFFDAEFECPERLISFRNIAKLNKKHNKEEEVEDEDILQDEDE